MIVVSHDRYFLNRVCTSILAFEGDGRLHYTVGNYDYYLEKRGERVAVAGGADPGRAEPHEAGVSAPGDDSAKQTKPRKLKWKEERELEGMEAAILAAEDEVVRLEAIFCRARFLCNARVGLAEAGSRTARGA